MNITVISDVHGRQDWKTIVEINKDSDLFIFLGDYLDSWDISPINQFHNLLDIIEFKNNNLDKVILLLGNHDISYISYFDAKCSGFNPQTKMLCEDLLIQNINKGLFKMCHKVDYYLFSHAGVSKTWCKQFNIDTNDLEKSINENFIVKPKIFKFNFGNKFSSYGDEVCQTPVWIRPNSLDKDSVDEYIQIVGHSEIDNIILDKYDSFILTDCQENRQYLTILNNEPKVNYY